MMSARELPLGLGLWATAEPGLPAAGLEALSQVLLMLHRGSREWPAARFAPRAVELIGVLMPFDACLWGSVAATAAVGGPLDGHGLHAQGLGPDDLALCLRGQGPLPGLVATALEPLAARRIELRLWRHGAEACFTPTEVLTLQFVMPHLVEARRENRLSQAREARTDTPDSRSQVLCDAQGVLQEADERGLALLRSEWPRWCGPRLPEPLARAAVATQVQGHAALPFHGRQITVLLSRSGESLWLEVRRRTAVDRLSSRQRDIAMHYADGQTGPQIAERLGLSPSTVNNHLGAIFKKLDVSSKLQLLHAMRPR